MIKKGTNKHIKMISGEPSIAETHKIVRTGTAHIHPAGGLIHISNGRIKTLFLQILRR